MHRIKERTEHDVLSILTRLSPHSLYSLRCILSSLVFSLLSSNSSRNRAPTSKTTTLAGNIVSHLYVNNKQTRAVAWTRASLRASFKKQNSYESHQRFNFRIRERQDIFLREVHSRYQASPRQPAHSSHAQTIEFARMPYSSAKVRSNFDKHLALHRVRTPDESMTALSCAHN